MEYDSDFIAEELRNGRIGVLPTDTLYGVVASALNPDSVERIYKLKQRNPKKPLIVLIPNTNAIEQFGVEVSEQLRERLSQYWPGPYSVILPTIDEQFDYLHRGTDTIAFRVPGNDLVDFLEKSGPLVAPSANPEGCPPASTIAQARRYFGSDVDFYVDDGALEGKPSTILSFEGDDVIIERN